MLTYIGAGVLGGLVLNVMPCVLPVLFFKVHGWIHQNDLTPRARRREAYAFLAGVLACFTVLAGFVVLLRSTGENMIWGEQMANPYFVQFIVVLLFVFGLNALGVFEIAFALSGGDQNKDSVWAAFSHGALITLVSTPCSAPILGAATTAALAQSASWYETLILFWSIGFGLSLPVLVIGLVPQAHALLPKPGPWMNVFKSAVGFTLIASAVFFLDTYQAQVDPDTFLGLLYFLVVIALVLRSLEGIRNWASGFKKRSAQGAIFLSAVIAGYALLPVTLNAEPINSTREVKHSQGVPWRAFQADSSKGIITLDLAKKANQPVFVDFTADWCVNCKAFEKTHIEIEDVIKAFRETGVWAAKADYTKKDPSLKKLLKALGRGGLPTYAIYFPDGSVDLLPEGPPIGLSKRIFEAAKKVQ